MLVLSRKIGEHIVIGNNTIVFVRAVSGKRVRLAIDAPSTTKVLRGELSRGDDNRSAASQSLPVEVQFSPIQLAMAE